MAKEVDPAGNAITYVYDVADRLTQRIDRLGRTKDFAYDNANQLIGQTWTVTVRPSTSWEM